MRTIILIFLVGFSTTSFSQFFELKKDLNDDKVAYQGIIELDSLSSDQLTKLTKTWSEKSTIDQTTISMNEVDKVFIYSVIYKLVGKKSEFGNAYDYRFTSELKLELKDNKVRYTLYNFKKKTSPGEPGSTLEYYIENYNKKGMSVKTKSKDELRLDEIEMDLQDKIDFIIDELKNHFSSSEKDW